MRCVSRSITSCALPQLFLFFLLPPTLHSPNSSRSAPLTPPLSLGNTSNSRTDFPLADSIYRKYGPQGTGARPSRTRWHHILTRLPLGWYQRFRPHWPHCKFPLIDDSAVYGQLTIPRIGLPQRVSYASIARTPPRGDGRGNLTTNTACIASTTVVLTLSLSTTPSLRSTTLYVLCHVEGSQHVPLPPPCALCPASPY